MSKLRNTPHRPVKLGAVSIQAVEMAKALEAAARKLKEAHIIHQDTLSILLTEASRLKRKRKSTSWRIAIDREHSVVFAATTDRNGKTVVPRLFCAGIEVDQGNANLPPFSRLDVGIEILDEEQKIVARWHVDLANENGDGTQDGPLTHLQYGGHIADKRELDHRLKVPRWTHPPMDLILLSEVIAANFYPNSWEDIREDQAWREAIMCGQKLCYTAYINKLQESIQCREKTILHCMWASEWC